MKQRIDVEIVLVYHNDLNFLTDNILATKSYLIYHLSQIEIVKKF